MRRAHIADFHVCKLRNERPLYCSLCQNRIALGGKVHYGEGHWDDDDRSYCDPCYKLLVEQWVANNLVHCGRKWGVMSAEVFERSLAEQRNLNARVAGVRLRGRQLLATDRDRRREETAAFWRILA